MKGRVQNDGHFRVELGFDRVFAMIQSVKGLELRRISSLIFRVKVTDDGFDFELGYQRQ